MLCLSVIYSVGFGYTEKYYIIQLFLYWANDLISLNMAVTSLGNRMCSSVDLLQLFTKLNTMQVLYKQ